jgi:hypothetical protein
MSATLHDITHLKLVPVLAGAAEELVTHRELRHSYCTNRSIKTWSTYFLLKSLTTSGVINAWTKQKSELLAYVKCTENAFRARLSEMAALKLVSITSNRSLLLTSYQNAAGILGIAYTGTIKIEYNVQLPGQQIFQYFLKAQEIRSNQQKQTEALWYHAGKNPLLKDALCQQLLQSGANRKRLAEQQYFQQQLLKLQQTAFKEGSPLFGIIHTLRADINRSCRGIQKEHGYKSAQSVSYLKKRLTQISLASIQKISIESKERSRLYVQEPGEKRKKDAYKWIPAKQVTAWVLCDQLNIQFKTIQQKTIQHEKNKAA